MRLAKNKWTAIVLSILMVVLVAIPTLTLTGCSGESNTLPMVATGFAHTVVLREDGTVWAWGRNEEGQLGNGNRINQFRPVRFRIEPWSHRGVDFTPPEYIVQVASHKIHTMALGNDGSVWAGGWNEEGQLGANVGCRLTPIRVPFPDANTRIVDIDAGMLFSIALSDNGYVYGWGRNRHDLMGSTNMDVLSNATRIQGVGLYNIQQIAAGHEHVLALRDDGLVLAWGRNRNGQVANLFYPEGHPSFNPMRPMLVGDVGMPTPVEFPGNPRIVEVRAGGFHSLARCEDGNVYAWGRSDRGQIGDNESHRASSQPIPQRVNIENVVSITGSSGDSNVAILADGTLRSWGRNQEGQLGDGTLLDRMQPVTVLRGHGLPLNNIISIAVGEKHMSAVCGNTGDVLSWGSNWCGEIGNGDILTSSTPVQVRSGIRDPHTNHVPAPIIDSEPLLGVSTLAAGNLFTLALGNDGIVNGWGRNNHGQLIMQHSIDHRVATPLADFRVTDPMNRFRGIRSSWESHMRQHEDDENFGTFNNVTSISAGLEVGHAFGLAVRGGYAYGWGDNLNGWLGHGNFPYRRRTLGDEPKDNNPRRMLNDLGNPISATQVAAGGRHSLILRPNGQLYAAGGGSNGRLGHGMQLSAGGHDTSVQYLPVRVSFPDNTVITDIEAGMVHSFAIDAAGYLWAWGANAAGQLGTGTTNSTYTPTRVLGPTIRADGERVIDVSTWSNHTLAVTNNGRVFSWGQGWGGRLGHGNTNQLLLPTHINAVAFGAGGGMVAVSVGYGHSVAIRADGTVWTWGENARDQLGRSSNWQTQQIPTQISGIFDATAVVSGVEHSAIIRGSGATSRVYSWGNNNAGALGNGGVQVYEPRDDHNPHGTQDQFRITSHRALFAVSASGVHASIALFNVARADFPPVGSAAGSSRSVNAWLVVFLVFLILVILLVAAPLVYVTITKKPLTVGIINIRPFNFANNKKGNATAKQRKPVAKATPVAKTASTNKAAPIAKATSESKPVAKVAPATKTAKVAPTTKTTKATPATKGPVERALEDKQKNKKS